MATPLQGTESSKNVIQRVRTPHDAMIDMLIAKPGLELKDLAKALGYTVPWVSRVMNSDAFQARLAERKSEIIDPILTDEVNARFKGVTMQSLDILANKLEASQSAELALQTLKLTTPALGYGARQQAPVVNNSFVVALPQQAPDASSWAQKHAPNPGGIVDATPTQISQDPPTTQDE